MVTQAEVVTEGATEAITIGSAQLQEEEDIILMVTTIQGVIVMLMS